MSRRAWKWAFGLVSAVTVLAASACGSAAPAAGSTPAGPAAASASPASAKPAGAPSSAAGSSAGASAKPAGSSGESSSVAAGSAAGASAGSPGRSAGAGSGAPSGTSATASYKPAAPLSPAVTVKVGNLHSLAEAPAVIAAQRGYFQAEGLDVQLVDFTITSDALPALGTGKIDVMTGGVNPALFNAVARGVNVQLVADAGSTGPGHDWYGLNVRKDLVDSGKYKSPKDLKGMKVGVPGPYSILHYYMKVLLEKNGMTLKDVQIEPLGLPGSVTALANKGVDANATIEPFLSEPERQGIGKVVLRSIDVDPTLIGAVFLMSPDFRARQPEAAQRYMIAWERGVRDYLDAFGKNKGHDQMVKLLQDNKIAFNPVAEVPTYNVEAGAFAVKGLEDLLKWYQDEGQVKGEVSANKLVDFTLIQQAIKVLGPYSK
jgi:NitT/TauT family transport system substrate-binding protein